MPHIPRILQISKDFGFFLFGPRQTGKSTYLKEIFPESEALWYDFLLLEEMSRLQKNPSLFIEEVQSRNPQLKYVVIDEVQKFPQILDSIHYIIENTPNPPLFVLTGSSARKLKRGQANLLGGRVLNYKFFPLTYAEIQASELGFFALTKALELGTLPNIYLCNNKENAKQLLKNYVEVYLKEEIQEESLVRNLNHFVDFLRFAAEENGNTINYSKISQDVGVSSTSIKEYFQILEDTLLGFFLRPYSRTIRKKIIKSPKFYFFDTGVVRSLRRESNLALEPGNKAYGYAFEHFIIREFHSLNEYKGTDFEFSFYRTENGSEVDLIISTPDGHIIAIEIKASQSPPPQTLRGLKSFQEVCPEAKLVCLCTSPKKTAQQDIEIYPWQEFMNELFGL